MRRNLVKAAAIVGVALAVALIGWTPGSSSGGAKAGAAVGPSVILRLPETGTGLNGGKDVRVRVAVTCANASAAPITVRINQARRSRTIHGVGQTNAKYRCNGRTQHATALVHATQGVFIPGSADATADVQVCNPTGSPCVNGHDARSMNLVPPATTTTVSSTTSTT